MLPVVLHSLAVQTESNFEVIVTDNSTDMAAVEKNIATVKSLDSRFRHVSTVLLDGGSCYHSAEWAVLNECRGRWLCFPSDDSYYVPCFLEAMLRKADSQALELVYCNILYDARFNGRCYAPVNVHPMINSIDKTGFILERDWFSGFPGKCAGPSKADGELIESLVRQGIRHGKLEDVLVVHN